MSTAKVSVAIEKDELEWARAVARREGKSLSAVVSESLAERRRLAALREVVAWMGEGQPPVTKEELTAAEQALGLAPRVVSGRGPKKRVTRRR